MKNIFVFILLFFALPCYSKVITGEVSKELRRDVNQVYDSSTSVPLEGVVIKIPSKNYQTKTRSDGTFKLQTKIEAPTIMSLEKNGYKPYSMTIDSNDFKTPISIGIEKTNPMDIVVETNMIHIGDDSFSSRSANADDFSLNSSGAFYTKEFNIKDLPQNKNLFLIIGSIIGVDTIEAQRIGQSNVLTAYASPPEIFFNGSKISDIKINGDNQRIQIPKGLIKSNSHNLVTIKAGRNLYKTSYIDYDDIEFTNLLFEFK